MEAWLIAGGALLVAIMIGGPAILESPQLPGRSCNVEM
jgi:hypothetical protein